MMFCCWSASGDALTSDLIGDGSMHDRKCVLAVVAAAGLHSSDTFLSLPETVLLAG